MKVGIGVLAVAAYVVALESKDQTPAPPPAVSQSAFNHPVRVTGTNVKIRRFDDDKSEVIATISTPDTVDNLSVSFRASKYISVRLRDGREGYVSTDDVAEGKYEIRVLQQREAAEKKTAKTAGSGL